MKAILLLTLLCAAAPILRAQNVGVTDILSQSVDCCNQGLLCAQAVELTQTGMVSSISYYTFASGGGQMVLGVYDSAGPSGGPGNLLASTEVFNVQNNSWNTTPVRGSGAILVPGTYWLAYQVTSNDTRFPVNRTTGVIDAAQWLRFGSPLPSPFPPLSISQLQAEWSFYITLVPVK